MRQYIKILSIVKKIKKQPWVVNMMSPFFFFLIATESDHSKLPDDMPEDEMEKITCGEGGRDIMDGTSEHLAFIDDWAEVGPAIVEKWKAEMGLLDIGFDLRRGGNGAFLDKEAPNAIQSSMEQFSQSDYHHIIRLGLPDCEYGLAEEYVEKNHGVSSGGPTCRMIFIRKYVIKTHIYT
jgi:hypothetical protein